MVAVANRTGTITIQAITLAATQAALMELKTMQNPTPTGMTTLGLENEVPVPRPSLRSKFVHSHVFNSLTGVVGQD